MLLSRVGGLAMGWCGECEKRAIGIPGAVDDVLDRLRLLLRAAEADVDHLVAENDRLRAALPDVDG